MNNERLLFHSGFYALAQAVSGKLKITIENTMQRQFFEHSRSVVISLLWLLYLYCVAQCLKLNQCINLPNLYMYVTYKS